MIYNTPSHAHNTTYTIHISSTMCRCKVKDFCFRVGVMFRRQFSCPGCTVFVPKLRCSAEGGLLYCTLYFSQGYSLYFFSILLINGCLGFWGLGLGLVFGNGVFSWLGLGFVVWGFRDFMVHIVLIPIGHFNVQSCLLINFRYKPISLHYSWLNVGQPIRIDWVLYNHNLEFRINKKIIPMLTRPVCCLLA